MARIRVTIDDDLLAAAEAIARARKVDLGRILEEGIRVLINPVPSHQDYRELSDSVAAIAEFVGAQWALMPGAEGNPIIGNAGTYEDGRHKVAYDTRAALVEQA
uniref:Protein of unassigned function n=1 Tax=Methylobacterium oryzae CBMB20 TaxID=693986 RepID=A0A088B2Y3_9HYPH|nr:hypothetical protein [Methylobacterium oryzae]AGO88251.1 protein of unassigned function [Methylobacterium oryzae CBMB20]